ncbi:MAG: hypothetical protein ACJAYR_001084 [Sneathiella sp.]|jgi:hypothetical protein
MQGLLPCLEKMARYREKGTGKQEKSARQDPHQKSRVQKSVNLHRKTGKNFAIRIPGLYRSKDVYVLYDP